MAFLVALYGNPLVWKIKVNPVTVHNVLVLITHQSFQCGSDNSNDMAFNPASDPNCGTTRFQKDLRFMIWTQKSKFLGTVLSIQVLGP